MIIVNTLLWLFLLPELGSLLTYDLAFMIVLVQAVVILDDVKYYSIGVLVLIGFISGLIKLLAFGTRNLGPPVTGEKSLTEKRSHWTQEGGALALVTHVENLATGFFVCVVAYEQIIVILINECIN